MSTFDVSRESLTRYVGSPTKLPKHLSKKMGKKLKKSATHLHACSQFDIYEEYSDIRKTSIICTIGPKTKSVDSLRSLVDAGMNIVRLNFSHGDHEYHSGVIANLNVVRAEKDMPPIALALDTKGPEIRTGVVKDGGELVFNVEDTITLTTDVAFQDKCDQKTLFIDYAKLPEKVKIGDIIYIDDGLLSLKITEIASDMKSVQVTVINSATISSRKGVNLPNIEVDLPALSEKDIRDIKFGVKNNIDMVFASFVRKAEDVQSIRSTLAKIKNGKHVKIISKIENHEGVQKFDEILQESDGIMVARGDLGIEIPAQKVFLAQKMMIAKCNIIGKPIIVATQMLESMTIYPRPTRAEVSDVANAVLDGADCVMLSGETAKGQYPCESVKMMNEVCCAAESVFVNKAFYRQCLDMQPNGLPQSVMENICATAVSTSFFPDVAAIITTSLHGTSPLLLSKFRPQVPILVATTNPKVARLSFLSRGCYSFIYNKHYDQFTDFSDYIDEMIQATLSWAHKKEFITDTDKVVVVQGWASGGGNTNTMRVVQFSKDQ